jgi:phosphoserine phosphatase
MTKLVFFDLDGTLIDNPSSEVKFFFYLLKRRYFGWKQIWAAGIFWFRWLWRFKKEIFIKDKAYFYELLVSDISEVAAQFARQRLLPNIRLSIKELLDAHLQNKDIVVLLTGSPEFVADVVAKKLRVNDFYATKLAVNGERFSADPPLQHPYALEKLQIAQTVCDKYQVKITDTVAYANSIHDYALLNACGRPIVVTPDRKLRRIAKAKNWQIID